jgi:hypothetical protein
VQRERERERLCYQLKALQVLGEAWGRDPRSPSLPRLPDFSKKKKKKNKTQKPNPPPKPSQPTNQKTSGRLIWGAFWRGLGEAQAAGVSRAGETPGWPGVCAPGGLSPPSSGCSPQLVRPPACALGALCTCWRRPQQTAQAGEGAARMAHDWSHLHC